MSRIQALAALITTLVCAPVLAQPDFSHVEVQAEKVADGIYMLTGAGGNVGVSVGDDGVLLIDDQFAPMGPKILAAVEELSDQPVRFVLNTHYHGDHTGGNETLGKAGAIIVAHDHVREKMSMDQFLELIGTPSPKAPKAALPIVTFNDAATFHLNGETIRAFHVPPAHTDGDSHVLFDNADVLHMGDTFFNGTFPFIDTQNGGSVAGVIRCGEATLARISDSTKIIPGHGPLATKADLRAFVEMLKEVQAKVEPMVQAGKSADEIVALDPLGELAETWGQGFINGEVMTRIAVDGMQRAALTPPDTTSAVPLAAAEVDTDCEVCTYIVENKEQHQPYICRGLKDPVYQKNCVQVMESLMWWLTNEVYWLNYGCQRADGSETEWVRPCPAHVVCSWIENQHGQPYCPAVSGYSRPTREDVERLQSTGGL